MNEEENPDVARKKAKVNLDRLTINTPKKLEVRENKLLQKFKQHKGNPQNKLKALFAEMDAIYSYVGKFTACKKSCSHCCHIPVSVSEVEIGYIGKSTRRKRSRSLEPYKVQDNLPCPFLVNDNCSIYDYRPFVCRRHLVLTKSAYWCEVSRCNEVEQSQLRFSEIEKSFNLILQESRDGEFKDIREVFERT